MWKDDRKQKLKRDAIPTIFGFFVKKQVSTKDIENDGNTKSNVYKITSTQSSKCTNKEVIDDVENEINIETVINDTSEPTSSANMPSMTKTEERENKRYKELVKKQQLHLITMRKKIKALRFTIRMLNSHINNDKYKKAMSIIFNEDQVKALLKKDRIRNWTNETIQRALRLKFACGANGYEEVLRQGIPLPSLRTLRRKLVDFKFEPGISNEMFESLQYKKSFNKETDFECGLIFDEMAITSCET